MFTFTSALMRS